MIFGQSVCFITVHNRKILNFELFLYLFDVTIGFEM